MTDRRPLRVALLGYGLAGATFHAPVINSVPGLQLKFVVTADPERGAAAVRDHPGVEVLAAPTQVWARADEVDLVVVATPNKTHVPLALAAVEAGLAVVIDKPLALTAAEGERLVAAAHERGVLLSVFQNRRWDGDLLTVERLLAEGALGEVYRFESRFDRWRPQPKAGWRESADVAEGGGLLLDLGSHLVDQALHLFGPVRTVYAELDVRRAGVAVEDDVFLALTHESGVRSDLSASVVTAHLAPRMRVLGSAAAYVKHGLDGQEAALRDGARPGPGWGEEPRTAWGVLGAGETFSPVATEPGDYPAYYARVAAALRGEAPNPVPGEQALATLRVLDAARRSAAESRVVRVS